MNLYLIKMLVKKTGKETMECDTFDGFVVRSESEEKAEKITRKECDYGISDWDFMKFTLLAENVEGEEGIILSSFNAG